MLDFISSIFYGINKNKNGKEISNFDKYMPWNNEEFSGKISYELDNNEEFEVHRNFTKRNPQIFDINANDISKEFTIDKADGNKFFYEQTKVDEELFNMSMVIHQQEVELDNKSQNTLIQKASNIMLTGEDSVSYQKVLSKLNKRQQDEIGTLKSPTKPLYLTKQKVEELNIQKKELEGLILEKYEIEEEIKKKQNELKEEEEALNVLQKMQKIYNESKLEEEKINIHINTKEELKKNKEELEKELQEINPVKEKGKSTIIYFIPILIGIIAIALFFMQMLEFGVIGAIITLFTIAIILLRKLKEKKEYKKEKDKVIKQRSEIQNKIELIENEISSKDELIKELQETLELKIRIQKEQLKVKYPDASKSAFSSDEGMQSIADEQNYINGLKLSISQKELMKEQISNKIEKLAEIEEKLAINEEILKNLLQYDEAINIAKEALDIAYSEMKNSITPKFTENLSNSINSITCGKYKKVKVNEENDLVLETENGNYVKAINLSQGTIDQLYLSLRISSINELTKENMPIILDETFAYFDKIRLENVLGFLNSSYKDKQVIILTCTEREIDILDKIGVYYNKIILN